MKKAGLIVLAVITIFVLGATPPTCAVLGIGENFGRKGGNYYLLSLIPAVVLVFVWGAIFVVSRRPATRRPKAGQ
jgi:hypothetical protein